MFMIFNFYTQLAFFFDYDLRLQILMYAYTKDRFYFCCDLKNKRRIHKKKQFDTHIICSKNRMLSTEDEYTEYLSVLRISMLKQKLMWFQSQLLSSLCLSIGKVILFSNWISIQQIQCCKLVFVNQCCLLLITFITVSLSRNNTKRNRFDYSM